MSLKSNLFYSVWLPLIHIIYNLHNLLLLGFLTLSNINKSFHIFQRNFYRSRDHSNNSLGSGSVLNTETHEDQDRLRKKLENLELELKAAELVTTRMPLGNLNDISNDDVINHNIISQSTVPTVPTVKKKSSHKREAPQPQGLRKKRLEDEQEDGCIMCLKERAEISEKNDPKLSRCSEQRYSANKKMLIDSKVQRSKSDAQDKALEEGDLSIYIQGLKSKNSTISSKLIKRSKSFNRIFSYSMLNRSKEYRL